MRAVINRCSGWPARKQSKETFNLRKIVKTFLIDLKKARWKFKRAMGTIREEN